MFVIIGYSPVIGWFYNLSRCTVSVVNMRYSKTRPQGFAIEELDFRDLLVALDVRDNQCAVRDRGKISQRLDLTNKGVSICVQKFLCQCSSVRIVIKWIPKRIGSL